MGGKVTKCSAHTNPPTIPKSDQLPCSPQTVAKLFENEANTFLEQLPQPVDRATLSGREGAARTVRAWGGWSPTLLGPKSVSRRNIMARGSLLC